ncbi:MAG: SDR family NAD(P)-dependent oxidoreductase [Bacteroidales bacterium]|nr:SDR family NAD(P)-dependent oxidoreductase [Bacteroidales bacterium]
MKTILITGASNGIGYEMFKILDKKKYKLLLVSRNEEQLRKIKDESPNKDLIEIFSMDLSKEDAAQKLFDKCSEKEIEVDILINNAGFGIFGQSISMDNNRLKQMLTLNMITLASLCNLFGEKMKQLGSGNILNVASTAAYQPLPYFSAYAATKAFVLSFSFGLREELKKYNINVSVLSPGPTKTRFFAVAKANTEGILFNPSHHLTAKEVAEKGLKAMFSGKKVVIPGMRNKIMKAFSFLVPASATAKIMEKQI